VFYLFVLSVFFFLLLFLVSFCFSASLILC
jgi:hypothetical protein